MVVELSVTEVDTPKSDANRDVGLWVRSGRAFGTPRCPLSANRQTFSNSLLGATCLPVCNQKFPVPIAGNSSKEVSCFNGFVPAGRGPSTEIPCIFPPIREFQTAETRSLWPLSTATLSH